MENEPEIKDRMMNKMDSLAGELEAYQKYLSKYEDL